MERATWKVTLPYVKQIAKGNFLHGSGNSNRGSASTYRGGVGQEMRGSFKREGIYVYLYGWFMLRFDRKQQNSVKQLSSNKK